MLAPDGRTWTLGRVAEGAGPSAGPAGVVVNLDDGQTCYAAPGELWPWPAGPGAPHLCTGGCRSCCGD